MTSVEQSTERQLNDATVDPDSTDQLSGANCNRPQLDELRRFVRAGDPVVVQLDGPARAQPG